MLRRPPTILLLTAVLFIGYLRSAVAAPLDRKIDRICRRFITAGGPGAAVAVIDRGQVIHLQCYGLANVRQHQAITDTTLFDLASVSKQFTATCIMLLADRSRLNLDGDVRGYLPEFPQFSTRRPMRISDLLCMRSGLPDYDDNVPGWTRARMMHWLRTVKLAHPIGTRYEYTNVNYVILGYVVEAMSRMPLRVFMKENIFVPLRMTHTTFFDDPRRPPPRAVGYAAHRRRFDVSRHDSPNTGDGNVFSCLDDMVKWEQALRHRALVKPATLRRARSGGRLDNGKRFDYGFGWVISHHPRTISHSGAWYGASAYISLDLDGGESVIVLSNLEDLADKLGKAIEDR